MPLKPPQTPRSLAHHHSGRDAFLEQKDLKQRLEFQDSIHYSVSMGNQMPTSTTGKTSTPALSWTDIPDIPHPWELLESPQVWVNDQFILDNDLYNNASSTCDFQSNLSSTSTSSPLLGETDNFDTFANIDLSLDPLIPTIESNTRDSSRIGHEQLLVTGNDLSSLDSACYRLSSPLPKTSTRRLDHKSGDTSLSNPVKAQRDRSQRHATAASDTPSSQDSDEDRVAERRRKNKLAARRLRQKKLDQVSDLEAQLEEVKRERDALRLRAAKSEGEVMALRQMIDQRSTL